MGILVNGVWQVDDLIQNKTDGKFIRPDSPFRDWITADGSPGPEGKSHPAERVAITFMSAYLSLGTPNYDCKISKV